jgi:hypothetical protein
MCVVLVGPVELAEAGEVVEALAKAGAVARAGDDALSFVVRFPGGFC